jgi:ubiquinone/menaquinone biosynthesis C-methylase UbiE
MTQENAMKQNTLISHQFGNTAQAYLSSCVHAEGADLQRLSSLTCNYAGSNALDLGCGAGHAAYAMAKAGASITAYDLSPKMLALVEKEAVRRGLAGITTQQGAAGKLPFADATFDLVVTRFSAHHWSDVSAAMLEVRRVLKQSGILIVIDIISAENALFDTLLQSVEILRDASHIRDYRISEWHAMLLAAGFDVDESACWKLTMEFAGWAARMRTPELRVDAIRDVLLKASDEARQYFKVQADCSFDIDAAWFEAKPHG